MSDRPECRVVARTHGGKTEIMVHEPATGKTHRTGYTVSAKAAEGAIRDVRDRLERAGNRATVVEQEQ